jgi:hypothetical protein
MLGYQFFKSRHVNTLHFGLLDTKNSTIAFLNLASVGILFITIIKSSDIPIEGIPRSVVVVIHLLTNWAADQGYCQDSTHLKPTKNIVLLQSHHN